MQACQLIFLLNKITSKINPAMHVLTDNPQKVSLYSDLCMEPDKEIWIKLWSLEFDLQKKKKKKRKDEIKIVRWIRKRGIYCVHNWLWAHH